MTQAEALEILKTGANVFLTGEPGSGKTYTVNAYIAWLRDRGISPSITASTGIAATHVGGMTIHAWSGIGIRRTLLDSDLEFLARKEPLARRVSRAKVLIIDEISMLDARVLDLVEAVCRRLRGIDAPFGGLQVIFVGDFFQLPPVAEPGEPSRFAFSAGAWQRAAPAVCFLKEQHRQTGDHLSTVLSAMREGFPEEPAREHLLSRQGRGPESGERIPELYTHNADVDRLNAEQLGRLPGDVRRYAMQVSGKKPLVEQLRRGCLSPEVLELKEHALVMFTKNSQDGSFVNGTLGRIESFDAGTGHPVVRTRDGRRIIALPAEWTVEEEGKSAAKIVQVPLRLAWAITIHKSQGMSMDAAIMDLRRAFEYGQGYVALSRVRTLSGVFLLGINERALAVDPRILEEDIRFQTESEAMGDWLAALPSEELLRKQKDFIRLLGGRWLEDGDTGGSASHGRPTKIHDLEALRRSHANAYRPWSKAEEAELAELFKAGTKQSVIAERLGRERGGIRARLKKLGLIA